MINTMSPTLSDTGGANTDHQTAIIRPRILLTGLRRSGKTSIQRVIFAKMQPSQTQFLESTPHLTLNQFSCGSFINFQVQELPGQLHIFPPLQSQNNISGSRGSPTDDDQSRATNGGYDMERLLRQCNAVVYIIDAQDDYNDSISRLSMIILLGRSVNPKIRYEIFIHKVDQLSEDSKTDTQRDIHNRVRDRIADPVTGMDQWQSGNSNSSEIVMNFHLTSIYDHSIFEAFSKVIQKLIPQFGHLEYLLNYLLSASNIEKAFLFDVQTKISIANDSSATDMQMYELCCDMIDLLINMSEIYGQPNANAGEDSDELVGDNRLEGHSTDEYDENNEHERVHNGLHSTATDPYENISRSPINNRYQLLIETTSEPASSVFDSMSSSVIKLTGGRALYLKEINRHLALICVLREEALSKQAIIDYNVKQLKESIFKLFRLNQQTPRPPVIS